MPRMLSLQEDANKQQMYRAIVVIIKGKMPEHYRYYNKLIYKINMLHLGMQIANKTQT